MNKMICVRFSSNQTNKLKRWNLTYVAEDVGEDGVEDNGDYCNEGKGEDGGECGAKIRKVYCAKKS